jgi:outer membrane protein with beta-barrel domain
MANGYRTQLLIVLPVVTLMLGVGTAHAQGSTNAGPGFYVGLSAGVQTRAIGVDVNLGTAAEWSKGFAVSPSIGFRFPGDVRAEFEFATLDNNNVGFFLPPYPNGPRENSAGHVTLSSLMTNVYYDMQLGSMSSRLSRVSALVGVGLGSTVSRIQGVTSATLQAGIPGIFGPTVLDTASRYTKTWQTRLGASVRVTNRADVFADWRHYKTGQLNFKTIQFPEVDVVGANIQEFEGGIRIAF